MKKHCCPHCLREDCPGEFYEECENDNSLDPTPFLTFVGLLLLVLAVLISLGLWFYG